MSRVFCPWGGTGSWPKLGWARSGSAGLSSRRSLARCVYMKSAYELAMERLAQSDPASGAKLTPAKKNQLAEIDLVYKGKIAEREIFLKRRLNEALAAGSLDESEKIRTEMAHERARLEEDREDEKESVRRGK